MTDLLRAAMAERWWFLPDRQFRVAITLLAMADSSMQVTITSDQLARSCGSNRTTLRRSLESLAAVGFCEISARAGGGGETQIVLSPLTPSGQSDGTPDIPSGHSEGTSLPRELLCESLAAHGDRGHSKPPDPGAIPDIQANSVTDSRARDQDLQRSDPDPDLRSDLRSTTSRDLSNKMVGDSADPADPPAKRQRINPDRIPERAWAAADYLRSRVLLKNPAALVGNKPWDYGYQWAAGAGDRIGDGSRIGLRLSWADEFRLFHARVHAAMKNADASTTSEAAWDEISRTVHWLFHNQTGGAQFVIESPGSIAKKWDRIQEIRNRPAEPPRGANGRPDPIAKRDWIPADQWGKK